MFSMREIGERLRTQDNRITNEPIFLVEQKRRHYGMDPSGDDVNITWLDGEYSEVTASKAASLEKKYEETGKEPGEYHRAAYIDRWEFVQCCFTEAAAQRYIDENKHNLKVARIFVSSAYRNKEWIAIRKYLMSLEKPEGVENASST